jgi:hypothetical protein
MKKPSGFGDDVILFDLHAWCVSVFGGVPTALIERLAHEPDRFH